MCLLSTLTFDQLLTAGAFWLLTGCACWAGLIAIAAVLETVTGGRLLATTWLCCPRSLRRVLLAGLGAALVSGSGAATAGSPASGPTDGQRRAAPNRTLPVPARPLGPAGSASTRIVVRPGDSLWSLAEVQLREPAPAAVVADLVTSVHRRNREVIGPDPDLIRPGQRLVLPARSLVQDRSRATPTPRGEP